jgi:hypothetical protein
VELVAALLLPLQLVCLLIKLHDLILTKLQSPLQDVDFSLLIQNTTEHIHQSYDKIYPHIHHIHRSIGYVVCITE